MRDGYMMTNVDTVINAHVYHAASILASFAQLTNHTSSVGLFSNAASQIYRNVNAKLINSSGMYHYVLYSIPYSPFFLLFIYYFLSLFSSLSLIFEDMWMGWVSIIPLRTLPLSHYLSVLSILQITIMV